MCLWARRKRVEVSKCGGQFLPCAGLWEFIASLLKLLYKMSSVLMSRPSGIFQDWGFPFVLLFACCAWDAKKNYLEGAKAALALSERCPPACLEPRPVSGQTEERAQIDQVQAPSRAPGSTWKAPSWHSYSVECPHVVWHYHTWCDMNGRGQGSGPQCTPGCCSPQGDLAQPG